MSTAPGAMKLELKTGPAAGDLDTVRAGMRRYELSRLPDEIEDVPVAVFSVT